MSPDSLGKRLQSDNRRVVGYTDPINRVLKQHTQACAVCGSPVKPGATRYCGIACYRQVQRSGDMAARFWSKVNKDGPVHRVLGTRCWLWTASELGDTGYGGFGMKRADGKYAPSYAHRVAWELLRGPIPPGMSALHACDVPLCVNAEAHLFLGTQLENMRDAALKGRLNVPRLAARKLSEAQRADVRSRYAVGDVTLQALADEYRVSRPHIWKLVHKLSVEFRNGGAA